jgi:hypothetical protein
MKYRPGVNEARGDFVLGYLDGSVSDWFFLGCWILHLLVVF